MATKWKNYDTPFRILAIALACITALSGCFFAYYAARNWLLFDTKNSKTYYDSPYFLSLIDSDITSIRMYAAQNNKTAQQARQDKIDEFDRQYQALSKEQDKMEIRLDQMIWLQNNLPKNTDSEYFNSYLFVNCETAQDYFDAFSVACPSLDEAEFLSLIDSQALPEVSSSSAGTGTPDNTETAASDSGAEAPTAKTTETLPNTNETTVVDSDTGDVTELRSETYFDETEDSLGTVLNPYGYAAELSNYTDPETWLSYYFSIRTYLVSRVGTPVYSENVYNYFEDNIDKYQVNDSDWYNFDYTLPVNGFVQYLFIIPETGEYLTNMKEYIPERTDGGKLYLSDKTEAMASAVRQKINDAPWGFSVNDNGIEGDYEEKQQDPIRRTVLNLNAYTNMTQELLGGQLYMYADSAAVGSDSNTDAYLYGREQFDDAGKNDLRYQSLAAMLAAAFLLTALYILCAGTQRKTTMDKLYNDWHFLLSTALICFAVAGIGLSVDARWSVPETYYGTVSNLLEFCVPLLSAVILLIALEYLVSVIRSGRNGRLFRHSFWFALPAFFGRKIKARAARRIKENPTRYQKQYKTVLAVGIVYTVVTTVFCTIGSFFFLALPVLAADILILLLLLQDVKALDLITESAERIRGGDYSAHIDLERIPRHLQPLAADVLYSRDGMRDAIEKSVRDERMKAELITNVSHDLKTPLTSVVTYVDLLKKCDIQDERARQYISIIDEKADRLKHLIEDLTEASKASTGNIRLNRMNVNLYEMALQAIGENSDDLEKLGIEVIINEPEGETVIFADNQQTWRIIDNLFSNVKKYAMPGTRVYVDVREINNRGVFSMKNVSKYPLNIPAEELTQRFVRGDEARTGEGSGLGLSIARSLCELQNGVFRLDIDGDLFKATIIMPKAYRVSQTENEQEAQTRPQDDATASPEDGANTAQPLPAAD